MPSKPLEGIKVADFSWSVVGPLTTKTLADYGAEVLKIESSIAPDLFRTLGPFKDNIPGFNRGGVFNEYNTNKLSVTLNLQHPKGVQVAKRLAKWADVVVENFAQGVMAKIGLSYDELRKVNPGIIYLSSCMMGQTGPHAGHPGWGGFLTALAGFDHITGWPDREPVDLGPYTDFVAPPFCVAIIMAAILYRQRTGKGQYLDVSQYECAIQLMAPLVLDTVVNKRIPGRIANRSPYAAPHGAYRCQGRDKWCAIAVFSDEEWKSLCGVIGNSVLSENSKFATLLGRKENEKELDKLIEEWTTNYPAEDVMIMMQAAGVPAGVLQTGEDIVEHDPQLRQPYYFCELDHPEIGKYCAPAPSFILSKSPYELKRAPTLGEHTEYALREILGMADDEIADLVIEGVIQ